MNFQEFVECYQIVLKSSAEVALWRIDPELVKLQAKAVPEIRGCHAFLLIISGELEMTIENQGYRLVQDTLVDIMHELSFHLSDASDNLNAYLLLMTIDFMDRLVTGGIPITLDYLLHIRENPVIPADPDDMSLFLRHIIGIRRLLEERSHLLMHSVLKHSIWILFAELANYCMREKELDTQASYSDREKSLFADFQKLLFVSICSEHAVEFYASKLCITPQFLRRVVKRISGKTIHTWINETLTNEIIWRLTSTDMTIQQIADELHFSEQSSLTRFFKKMKGMAPITYRHRWKKP